MSDVVIRVENLYKEYRLGTISHGTLYRDLQSWWARIRGKEDPNSIISAAHSLNHVIMQPSTANPHFLALNDVSFEVQRGEVLGIIGRNGAGKSTLLKILSEVTLPTKGVVKIRGRVASLLEVGTGFHPELTGRENIYLNGAILGMTKKEIGGKFDEIADFAELDKFIDTPVKRYSSGMYVRLAFAVAAHLEPEILIVDEVLAVGDAQFQKKCLGKMGEVSKEGRTVLCVSHNMAAVSALCTRALLFVQGSKLKDGEPDETISAYLSEGPDVSSETTDLKKYARCISYREPAIAAAWLEDSKGAKITAAKMGDSVSICMQFSCAEPVTSPGFGFRIEDREGRTIFSLNNHMVPNDAIGSSVQRGVAKLYIPVLQLVAGTYYVTFSLTTRRLEYIDRVERALTFSVDESDVYRSGVVPQKNQGLIFIEGKIFCESAV
jgi:lipopolysaccharide transport system ATP-binding protein